MFTCIVSKSNRVLINIWLSLRVNRAPVISYYWGQYLTIRGLLVHNNPVQRTDYKWYVYHTVTDKHIQYVYTLPSNTPLKLIRLNENDSLVPL